MSHRKLRGFKDRKCAYVDGSFNPKNGLYGAGVVLISGTSWKTEKKYVGSDPEWAKMRNVAGEILGAMKVIELAFQMGITALTIYHDYIGIGKWPTGEWECRNNITKQYANYVTQMIINGMEIKFQHVKSHSGIPENDRADKLARESVGIAN